MARTKISEFSSTAASNTDIDGINIAEGCSPSGINDAIRELMSQLKDWQAGTSNDPYVVGSSGSLTLNQGTANGVLYLNGSKVATSGSALTFDGSKLEITRSGTGFVQYWKNGTVTTALYQDSSVSWFGNTSNHSLVFATNDTEQMRLTSTGLGIGTSSPAEKLEVAGNILIKNSGNPTLTVKATGGGNDPKIYLTADTNSFILNGAFSPSTDLLEFKYNSSSLMALDQNGNLGLGVTPSAWGGGTGNRAIEVGFIGSGLWSNSTNNTVVTSNAYFNGSGWIYGRTGTATISQQDTGAHKWYNAPSGTAGNAITFSQAMTLDASGRQLVGNTTSVGTAYQTNIQVKGSSSSNYGGLGVVSSNNEMLGVVGVWSNAENSLMIAADPDNLRASSSIVFTTDGSERARIDSSGNLLVGTTGLDGRFRVEAASGASWARVTNHTNSGTQYFDSFRYNGTEIGKITGNNSNVSYVTSSDYRLKENIAPMTDALATVAQLKPCTYTWKIDGAAGQGFIAHELQAVVPDAVVGEKDAVNEDGSIKPQGIDTSFLVATLTAAIQELNAKFEAYKASHP